MFCYPYTVLKFLLKLIIDNLETKKLSILNASQAAEVFELIAQEGIENRYVYGSCEDRSHYIFLFLKKAGLNAGKIWAYPPAKYSYQSDELIHVNDPLGISENITWGYHVAPFILVEQNNHISKLIIDLSFSENCLISLEDWILKLNCENLVYNFSDGESYLFYSYDSVLMRDFTSEPFEFPPSQQEVFNVSYWQLTTEDKNIPKDLALNDLAVYVFNNLGNLNLLEKEYFLFVLSDISYLEFFALYEVAESISEETISLFVKFYKQRFIVWELKYLAISI